MNRYSKLSVTDGRTDKQTEDEKLIHMLSFALLAPQKVADITIERKALIQIFITSFTLPVKTSLNVPFPR